MKRFVLSVMALIFMAGLAWAGEMRIVNSPGDGYLNLRTGPGSQYSIIRRMYHGSMVDVLERAGKWSRVQHEETGSVGWAFHKYLAPFQGDVPMKFIYSPGDGYLNLRTGPGTRYNILRRMYNGESVEILERKGTWVRVYHQSGAQGWCSAKFLRN